VDAAGKIGRRPTSNGLRRQKGSLSLEFPTAAPFTNNESLASHVKHFCGRKPSLVGRRPTSDGLRGQKGSLSLELPTAAPFTNYESLRFPSQTAASCSYKVGLESSIPQQFSVNLT
jgi:hypothetical protein